MRKPSETAGTPGIEVTLGTGSVLCAPWPTVDHGRALTTRVPEVRVHAPETLAVDVARAILRATLAGCGDRLLRADIDDGPPAPAVWRADVEVGRGEGRVARLRIEACRAGRCTPGRAILPGVADVWIGPDGLVCAREAGQAEGRWVPVELSPAPATISPTW